MMNNQSYPYVYGNGTWPMQMNYQQVPQYPYQYQQPYQQQQNLSGKYVDSVDVVKATEVPMGGSGVFPKADMSEVYIKTWNADGTTKILTFKPVVEQETKTPDGSKMEDILAQISALNAKMDKLSTDLGA